MNDFSKMLATTLSEARKPKVIEPGEPQNAQERDNKPLSLVEVVREVNDTLAWFKQTMGKMEMSMEHLFTEMESKTGNIKTQFKGLRSLTREQKEHIVDLTKHANERVKELK